MFVSNVGGIIAAASKESAHPLRKTGKIPAIKRIVLSMQQAGLFPIVVVVGADDYESRYQLNNLNVVFLILEESEEKRELFHSVKAGLSYLQDKCLSVVFTPVNAPMFIPKTIVEMRKHHDDIVVPSYKKKAGHPVLISNEMIPDILAYDGENGLRGAIEKYAERRVFVEVDDIGVLSLNQEDDELQSQIEEHNKSILHPILTFGIGHETPFFNARLKLLLFLIEDLNNVRKACDTMALSPGKAWDMINELEDKLGYTVVKRRRGGRNGGKTFLTEDGRQFLITCQRFEEQVISFSEQKYREDRWGNVREDTFSDAIKEKYGLSDKQIEKVVTSYDLIISEEKNVASMPGKATNVYEQYQYGDSLHIEDLDCIVSIVQEKHPEYVQDLQSWRK